MFNRTLSALAAVALTGATLAIAVPAVAEPVGDPMSASVRFGDLDLTTPKGVARFESRLHAAADQVCDIDAFERQAAKKVAACRASAIASGEAKANLALAAKSGARAVAMGTN
jgi:UrcA family protein